MSSGISNRFHIRLRAEKNLSSKERETSQQILQELLEKWYPNIFWSQRFGINWRNKDQWKEILLGVSKLTRHKHPQRKEIIFKLQAYASFLFNAYYFQRQKNWLELVDGDILFLEKPIDGMDYGIYDASNKTVTCIQNKHSHEAFKHPKRLWQNIPYDKKTMHLTGPVLGYDLLLPDSSTPAWKLEKDFFKEYDIDEKQMQIFKERKVFGLRRNLWVLPTDSTVRLQWDDILLDFTLPAGAYASTLIDSMKRKLEIKEMWITKKLKHK
jgi:tRNA(Glu) U13 pseudouridine synthase TruD